MPRSDAGHKKQTSEQAQINQTTGVGGSRVAATRRASTINGRAASSVFALGKSVWDGSGWVWRAS